MRKSIKMATPREEAKRPDTSRSYWSLFMVALAISMAGGKWFMASFDAYVNVRGLKWNPITPKKVCDEKAILTIQELIYFLLFFACNIFF